MLYKDEIAAREEGPYSAHVNQQQSELCCFRCVQSAVTWVVQLTSRKSERHSKSAIKVAKP